MERTLVSEIKILLWALYYRPYMRTLYGKQKNCYYKPKIFVFGVEIFIFRIGGTEVKFSFF